MSLSDRLAIIGPNVWAAKIILNHLHLNHLHTPFVYFTDQDPT